MFVHEVYASDTTTLECASGERWVIGTGELISKIHPFGTRAPPCDHPTVEHVSV
jgi:hypothetical protein